jgi:hypothetical protein
MTTALQPPLAGSIATTSAAPSEPQPRPALTLRELVDTYMAAYVGRDPEIGYRLVVWIAELGGMSWAENRLRRLRRIPGPVRRVLSTNVVWEYSPPGAAGKAQTFLVAFGQMAPRHIRAPRAPRPGSPDLTKHASRSNSRTASDRTHSVAGAPFLGPIRHLRHLPTPPETGSSGR